MSLDVYTESERIVAALTDEQCDAVMAALERRVDRWELEHRRPAAIATRQTPVAPARRRPGWLEAIRGVECCDPAVRDQWRMWRRWIAVAIVIIGVVLALEPWHIAAGIGTACVISLGLGFSMLRGKASACH
jgi:hypothetical protein